MLRAVAASCSANRHTHTDSSHVSGKNERRFVIGKNERRFVSGKNERRFVSGKD